MHENNKKQKQEATKLQTFPVPFALEAIKEKISISTNIPANTSKEQIINQAINFHSQGNIQEAAKYYQYCINQGFNDHRVFSNYGVILKGIGELKEAKKYYLKAIQLKPSFAESYSNLGSILKDMGKLQDAEESTRKAIELKPDFALAYLNLGIILKDLGKLQEAKKYYLKAIELKPGFAEAYSNLGNTLKDLGQLQEAKKYYLKAIELKPDFAQAYSNLGSILREHGKSKEAEIFTRKAIKLNPNFAEAFANLGSILIDLGQLEKAELSIRKAIEIKPDFVEAHVKLGELLFDLGKPEEASISEWNAIRINTSSSFLKSYRKNSKLINKTAFWIHSCSIFNQFQPVIEINPESFEILVPDKVDNRLILKIRNSLKNKDIRIRSITELVENNLIYEQLVSHRGDDSYYPVKNNMKTNIYIPIIKLLGKKNIRFMYTAGKEKYTVGSYWNKYYNGILCYGPYHENKFKIKHKISTSQMGYPRFDKYFKPGFKKDYLIKKFKCEPNKKTIVWLPTWTSLSSIDKYHKVISSLRSHYNIVVRPHPSMKTTDPSNYKKLFNVDFTYIDDNDDDNVQLYALSDLMLFDYGGPMFGALYLNKKFAFLEMNLEAKDHSYLGKQSSEDYLKSYFPDRIAKLENLKSICNYCLENPPSESVIKSLREEFFNTSYQGDSAKRAYDLLISNHWLD